MIKWKMDVISWINGLILYDFCLVELLVKKLLRYIWKFELGL